MTIMMGRQVASLSFGVAKGAVMSENGISSASIGADTVLLLLNQQRRVLARTAPNAHPGESLIQLEGDQLVGLGPLQGDSLATFLGASLTHELNFPISLTLAAGDSGPVLASLHRLSANSSSTDEKWLMLQLHPVEPEPDFSSHELARCYRLTRTQAKILSALMRGLEPQAIALQYRITLPTVRTHLQHIREKLGCRKTSELIIRVMARNGTASLKTKNHQK